jgi:hypothetical protein
MLGGAVLHVDERVHLTSEIAGSLDRVIVEANVALHE